MKLVPPLSIRKLRAQMELKSLTMTSVATRAGIRLSRASEVLNGRRNDPAALRELKRVIREAAMPQEAAA